MTDVTMTRGQRSIILKLLSKEGETEEITRHQAQHFIENRADLGLKQLFIEVFRKLMEIIKCSYEDPTIAYMRLTEVTVLPIGFTDINNLRVKIEEYADLRKESGSELDLEDYTKTKYYIGIRAFDKAINLLLDEKNTFDPTLKIFLLCKIYTQLNCNFLLEKARTETERIQGQYDTVDALNYIATASKLETDIKIFCEQAEYLNTIIYQENKSGETIFRHLISSAILSNESSYVMKAFKHIINEGYPSYISYFNYIEDLVFILLKTNNQAEVSTMFHNVHDINNKLKIEYAKLKFEVRQKQYPSSTAQNYYQHRKCTYFNGNFCNFIEEYPGFERLYPEIFVKIHCLIGEKFKDETDYEHALHIIFKYGIDEDNNDNRIDLYIEVLKSIYQAIAID